MSHRRRTAVLARQLIAAAMMLPLAVTNAAFAADLSFDHLEVISGVRFTAGGTNGGVVEFSARSLSADGRYATWAAGAAAIVPGVLDRNGALDVFLADRADGSVKLISHLLGDPTRASSYQSSNPWISADGRYIGFESFSPDLHGVTPADNVYLYDRVSDSLQMVSHFAGDPSSPAGFSEMREISADGRFVLFDSEADAALFVPGATDTFPDRSHDLFLWDRQNASFQLVTRRHDAALTTAPGGFGEFPNATMTPDGRFVAYRSTSNALVAGDASTVAKIFLFDRQTGTNVAVSRTPAGVPVSSDLALDITPSGRFTLFRSSADPALMVPGADNNFTGNLFLFDRQSGAIELISRAPQPGVVTGDRRSTSGWLSDDGLTVYFASNASNLTADDNLLGENLYLRNRTAGTTVLLTRDPDDPSAGANGDIPSAFAAADGSAISFTCEAALIAGMTGLGPFTYRYERGTGQISLLSHAPAQPSAGVHAEIRGLSDDGRYHLWSSNGATALTGAADPQPDTPDVIAHDRIAGDSLVYNAAQQGGVETGLWGVVRSRLAPDGSKVAFTSRTPFCSLEAPIANQNRRACLLDRATGEVRTIATRWDDPAMPVQADNMQFLDFSQDGRWLLFQSDSPELTSNDVNATCDIFLHDAVTGTNELISHRATTADSAGGLACQEGELRPRLSHDATRAAFEARSVLIVGSLDAPGSSDVYVKDRTSGIQHWLTTDVANPAAPGNDDSFVEQISGNGSYVVVRSAATNLVAGFVNGNGTSRDLILIEVATGTRTLVSRTAASAVTGGNAGASDARVSTDGRFVAFSSSATNHVAGSLETVADPDLFLFDRTTGLIQYISHPSSQPLTGANGLSELLGLTSDGRFVLFTSNATNLIAGISGQQIYRWDRLDDSLRLVSHAFGQPAQAVGGNFAQFSADGRRAIFTTTSSSVIPGVVDYNGGFSDLYHWQDDDPAITLISRRFGAPVGTGDEVSPAPFTEPQLSAAGDVALFTSASTNMALFDGNVDRADLYLAVLGSLFADGFETGSTDAWSNATP